MRCRAFCFPPVTAQDLLPAQIAGGGIDDVTGLGGERDDLSARGAVDGVTLAGRAGSVMVFFFADTHHRAQPCLITDIGAMDALRKTDSL
jgi:hypothetical protein